MQFNSALGQRSSYLVNQPISRSSTASPRGYTGSQQASDEIHAYIAARDMALVEAEGRPSDMTLNRAFLANQLVENTLKPARAPYQAQCLPEAEAARERKRCESADTRITQLRAAAPSRQYAVAA
jgi:hypothetical protein